MASLNGKFISFEALSEALEGAVEEAIGEAHANLLTALHEATPVDTTHAQNNWIAFFGSPGGGAVFGSKGSPNDSAHDLSKERLREWTFEDGNIHISNSVPYINRLNEGYSPQAPAGYIEDVVETELIRTFLGRFP